MRQDYIYIKFVKKLLPILDILIKINYISSYQILTNNTLIIYLFYKNKKPNWNNIKVYYRNSCYIYINIQKLKKFYFKELNLLLILSTSKGIMSHIDAIKFNIGGKLLFIVY